MIRNGPKREPVKAFVVQTTGRRMWHVLHLPLQDRRRHRSMDEKVSLEPWKIEAGFKISSEARPDTDKLVTDFDSQ